MSFDENFLDNKNRVAKSEFDFFLIFRWKTQKIVKTLGVDRIEWT